ncbi:unnamed protein product [Closterium sp. Yama58-4]|nr:unnamed protein product [Closterium sp. Yama58-4]
MEECHSATPEKHLPKTNTFLRRSHGRWSSQPFIRHYNEASSFATILHVITKKARTLSIDGIAACPSLKNPCLDDDHGCYNLRIIRFVTRFWI